MYPISEYLHDTFIFSIVWFEARTSIVDDQIVGQTFVCKKKKKKKKK